MKGLLSVFAGAVFCCAQAVEIHVDPSVSVGPVKPVNGVGQPPRLGVRDYRLFHYLTEAGIPFSRLHDVGGLFGPFVDIPDVFPDFEADENDPKSYRFGFTDDLLAALVKSGVKPFYRLGVSIENHVGIEVRHVKPPRDYAKWARICEHVMAHYLEGWADGFRYDVSHWEIWNEADISVDPKKSMMWQASFDEYVRLYLTAARHLKARFPREKIGGYASCGFYAAVNPKEGEQGRHHLACIRKFLDAVRREKAPLDFFSFHSYSGVKGVSAQIAAGRKILAEYGFGNVEMCLNEWLPNPKREIVGTHWQSSEIAATLVVFQNSTLDSAAIYDAKCGTGSYAPLFDPMSYKPQKAYYAFTGFNELRKLGQAVSATSDDADVYVAAAATSNRVAALIANFSAQEKPLTLKGLPANAQFIVTDKERTNAKVDRLESLPPFSFVSVAGQTGSSSPADVGAWRKYEKNPVLGNVKLGTCFDVNVVTDGPAPYTMYFSWRPKKAIALVRSDDAMSWTDEPEICLAADPSSGWEDDINRSCTVFKDGVWHMWYTGQAKGGSKIGYATSKDGVHFMRVRREPVLVPEKDYEKLSTMNPYVRWDETRRVWRMWLTSERSATCSGSS